MDERKRSESMGSRETGGVVQTWIDGTLDTTQAVLSGCVDILDQARTQVTERVTETLDWAEGFPRGAFSIARHVSRGVDTIAAQSIGAVDRVGNSILSAMRRGAHGARGLASDANSSIMGDGRPEPHTPAARMTVAS